MSDANQEVLTAEQAELVDYAKLLADVHAMTVRAQWRITYLIGLQLHRLKAITAHTQFEQIKLDHFPEISRSVLGRAMQFCDAVHFVAKIKNPTVGFLNPGTKLLPNGTLSDGTTERLEEQIVGAMKGGGILASIAYFRKKTYRPVKRIPARDPEAERRAANTMITEYTGRMRLLVHDLPAMRAGDTALLRVLEDERVAAGHALKQELNRRKIKP